MTVEPAPAVPIVKSGWLGARVRAMRAFSLPVSVVPSLVAMAVVLPAGHWRWDVVVAYAVAAGFLQAAGNCMNDYFDYRFGLDQVYDGRPGLTIARGEMTPGQVLAESLVLLGATMPMAAYLAWQCGPTVLAFGAVGIVSLYIYTGPPFRLKYVALGEPLIFLAFGPALMLGAAYAQTGRIETAALLASVPIGFMTVAILLGNNIRDREEDGAMKIRTLASFAGGRPARAIWILLVLGFFAGFPILAVFGLAPKVLFAMPLALALIREPLAAVWRGHGWGDLATQTAKVETVLLVAILAAYLIFPVGNN